MNVPITNLLYFIELKEVPQLEMKHINAPKQKKKLISGKGVHLFVSLLNYVAIFSCLIFR